MNNGPHLHFTRFTSCLFSWQSFQKVTCNEGKGRVTFTSIITNITCSQQQNREKVRTISVRIIIQEKLTCKLHKGRWVHVHVLQGEGAVCFCIRWRIWVLHGTLQQLHILALSLSSFITGSLEQTGWLSKERRVKLISLATMIHKEEEDFFFLNCSGFFFLLFLNYFKKTTKKKHNETWYDMMWFTTCF